MIFFNGFLKTIYEKKSICRLILQESITIYQKNTVNRGPEIGYASTIILYKSIFLRTKYACYIRLTACIR